PQHRPEEPRRLRPGHHHPVFGYHGGVGHGDGRADAADARDAGREETHPGAAAAEQGRDRALDPQSLHAESALAAPQQAPALTWVGERKPVEAPERRPAPTR